jgi:hypothetical protein
MIYVTWILYQIFRLTIKKNGKHYQIVNKTNVCVFLVFKKKFYHFKGDEIPMDTLPADSLNNMKSGLFASSTSLIASVTSFFSKRLGGNKI